MTELDELLTAPAMFAAPGGMPPFALPPRVQVQGAQLRASGSDKSPRSAAFADRQTLYVAGPMSGLPEWNFPAFFAAQEILERRGFRVLNPARHPAVEGESWESCLRRDLPDVLRADGLALLDGWWASRGARLEVQVASTLLVPCLPVNEWGVYR